MVEVLSLSVYAFKQYLITLEQIINKDKSIKGRKNVLSLIKAIRNRVAGDIKEYSATIHVGYCSFRNHKTSLSVTYGSYHYHFLCCV